MGQLTPIDPGVNGVPMTREFEDTGRLAAAVAGGLGEDPGSDSDLIRLLTVKLSGGGDGDGGARYAKEIKKHKWIAALMALVLGTGGPLAVIYATRDQSRANAQEIESRKAWGVQIRDNSNQLEAVSVDIKVLKNTVDGARVIQQEIASGIDELKAESINELKSDLAEARRELRRR